MVAILEDTDVKEGGMITFYASANDGSVAKCEFIDMDHALYGWLTLIASEEFTFRMITKKQFERRTKNKNGFRKVLSMKGEIDIVGYFTEIL